jgi:hypothetical protein
MNKSQRVVQAREETGIQGNDSYDRTAYHDSRNEIGGCNGKVRCKDYAVRCFAQSYRIAQSRTASDHIRRSMEAYGGNGVSAQVHEKQSGSGQRRLVLNDVGVGAFTTYLDPLTS